MINSTLKAIVILGLAFLQSCGTFVNLTNHSKTKVYTRSSSTVFLTNPENISKVYIKVSNITGFEGFLRAGGVIKNDIAKKYQVVENIADADLFLDIKIRSFSSIPQKVIENIERYWQYNDTAESTTIKEVGRAGFSISDDNVSIGDAQSSNLGVRDQSGDGMINKMITNDLTSGLAIGGVLGFTLSGGNPVGGAIGGMFGAGISMSMQHFTDPKSYLVTVDISIAEKIPQEVIYNEKYLHKQDDNGMRWYDVQYKKSNLQKRIKLFGVVKRTLMNPDLACDVLTDKIANAISNGI